MMDDLLQCRVFLSFIWAVGKGVPEKLAEVS